MLPSSCYPESYPVLGSAGIFFCPHGARLRPQPFGSELTFAAGITLAGSGIWYRAGEDLQIVGKDVAPAIPPQKLRTPPHRISRHGYSISNK